MTLTPKNWSEFQHYKDRSPSWIKLHRGLLDNVDYYMLSDSAGKALPLLWLLASERDGTLPSVPEIAFRLRIDVGKVNGILEELVQADFIVNKEGTCDSEHAEHDATQAQRTAARNGFGSRHIPDRVKHTVWVRDSGKCCQCGSEKDIEYDHKMPVSKGGNSEEENIQLLCRPCNRSKRVTVATQALGRRSLEERREENKKEKDSSAVVPTRTEKSFDEFWSVYPKREGANPKHTARKAFFAAVKVGVDPDQIVSGAKRCAQVESSKIGTPYIPQAIKWLRDRRWEDYAEPTNIVPIRDVIHVLEGSPEMDAWDRYYRKTTGKNAMRSQKFGGFFPPTKLPPTEDVA